MNDYQMEQRQALQIVRRHLHQIPLEDLEKQITDYLYFRQKTARFYNAHIEPVCEKKCFTTGISGCCTKDGIIVFFADVVINALQSTTRELDRLEQAIGSPSPGGKCIFLAQNGCTWQVKPIVCEMFICHPARQQAFANSPSKAEKWKALEQERKTFTWPDQPVLFERLESLFLNLGQRSTLMHIHKSPGLLRVKQNRDS
ncbi:MAG: hypothetical protein KFF46_07510 [Desulfobacterales bacterium]|nr:hypothetical protein [Desulfobacterales bacterium]